MANQLQVQEQQQAQAERDLTLWFNTANVNTRQARGLNQVGHKHNGAGSNFAAIYGALGPDAAFDADGGAHVPREPFDEEK